MQIELELSNRICLDVVCSHFENGLVELVKVPVTAL